MINGKRVLALIPARGGSKGLPRKNILPLHGKPLVAWPIAAARGSKYVDRVVISTDDQEIAGIAVKYGCEAPFMRPAELASDTAPSFGFIKHAIEFLADQNDHYDYLLLLEPTSPLTEPSDVDSALEQLDSRRDIADSIVGVCKAEAANPVFIARLTETGTLAPFSRENFKTPYRRQDIPKAYFFEGSLYISDVQVLLDEGGFVHDRTLPYEVPRYKSVEIDELYDLILVEATLENLSRIQGA
jgi:N-acylneuraminate cytidylyltransferase/CMP-N,N'-diacetyllegionaminic acid synthase